MSEYAPRLDDINFLLNHVAGLEEVSKLNGYQHADPETVAQILEEAARFFSEVIAPLNQPGDRQGSVLGEDGTVRTPDGFKEAYRKYVEAGWAAAHMPEEWGGGGLPYVVGVVIEEMFKTANMAFALCPMLTHGAVEALVSHGSEAATGHLSGEAGPRRVERHHEPHRARGRLRPRGATDPSRPPGRWVVPPLRNQDLHHLGRPGPHRQRDPLRPGPDP